MAKTGWRFKLYPNGEFSGGYVADRKFDQPFEIDPNAFRHGSLWWFNQPELRRWQEERVASGEDGPLDLSIRSNSHKRRGLGGITSRGQRLVRNTAFMMQKKYSRRRLSFLTLTVPPMVLSDELNVCSKWSEVLRLFCQWLRRSLIDKGLPSCYVGVTEVQEKRWQTYQQVGLHLHIVFVGGSGRYGDWAFSPEEVRERWLDVLSHVVGRRVYSRSCENIQAVKKSAAGYLGKYMSKGVNIVNEIIEGKGEDFIPTSWYTCSMNLKKAFAKATRYAWDDEVNIMSRLPLLSGSGCIARLYIHTITIQEREMLVGVSGYFCSRKLCSYAPALADIVRIPSKHSEAYASMW